MFWLRFGFVAVCVLLGVGNLCVGLLVPYLSQAIYWFLNLVFGDPGSGVSFPLYLSRAAIVGGVAGLLAGMLLSFRFPMS